MVQFALFLPTYVTIGIFLLTKPHTIFIFISELTVEDLGKVYEELYEGREKWKNIGLKLGLNITMLNIIEKDRQYKTEPCCLDMLKEWLTNGTNRSWSALADAMESPIVSLSNIAAALRKRYCN